jgi:hypothetical protein
MATRKDKRMIRARIVRAAARKQGCTVEDIFFEAMPDADVEPDLNKIPDQVLWVARELLRAKHPARLRPRVIKERYFRIAPYFIVCRA